MWIHAKTFTDLLTRTLAAEARSAETDKVAAVQQQNFDWLANHVNRLESERALLLERLLGLGFAVPNIQRVPSAPPERLHVEDRPDTEDPGMAFLAMQSGSFEDMGDERAQQMGITHDQRTGTVIFTS